MEYVFVLFVFAISLLIILRSSFFKNIGLSAYDLAFLFGVKVLTGTALYFIYTYYYTDRITADIFKYFDDGLILKDLAYCDFPSFLSLFFGFENSSLPYHEALNNMNFWSRSYNFGLINDNQTIIRANCIIHFFSFGNYHIHNIIFNLFSFAGLIAIWKFLNAKFQVKKWMLLLSLFLFPTILLWTSGVLKESILIFALGFFLYFFFVKAKAIHKVFSLAFLFLLLGMKPYVIISLLPGFLFLILRKVTAWKNVSAFFLTLVISISAGLLVHFFSPINFLDYIIDKQKAFFNVAEMSDAGSVYYFPELSTYLDLILYSPLAFFNCLFRPFLWEANGVFSLLASAENLFFILLVSIFCLNFRRGKLSKWEVALLLFVMLLSVLIGLTTPIFGAMVRYKMPMIPFLLIIILTRIDYRKIYDKLPFLKSLDNL